MLADDYYVALGDLLGPRRRSLRLRCEEIGRRIVNSCGCDRVVVNFATATSGGFAGTTELDMSWLGFRVSKEMASILSC